MEARPLTHAASLLCISHPASVMWELMMLCVWRSRRCHFPSSAAAVTWRPSERSIRRDKAALCLHNRVQSRLASFAASRAAGGPLPLREFMALEMERDVERGVCVCVSGW